MAKEDGNWVRVQNYHFIVEEEQKVVEKIKTELRPKTALPKAVKKEAKVPETLFKREKIVAPTMLVATKPSPFVNSQPTKNGENQGFQGFSRNKSESQLALDRKISKTKEEIKKQEQTRGKAAEQVSK